jgi:hypothetical protein
LQLGPTDGDKISNIYGYESHGDMSSGIETHLYKSHVTEIPFVCAPSKFKVRIKYAGELSRIRNAKAKGKLPFDAAEFIQIYKCWHFTNSRETLKFILEENFKRKIIWNLYLSTFSGHKICVFPVISNVINF